MHLLHCSRAVCLGKHAWSDAPIAMTMPTSLVSFAVRNPNYGQQSQLSAASPRESRPASISGLSGPTAAPSTASTAP